MRRLVMGLVLAMGLLGGVVAAGERAFNWSMAPARNDYVGADLNPYNLGKYLSECEINRPEVLAEVRKALADGNYYRKSTKDQKGRQARITVSVNPEYHLRIVTWRNETCPECKGGGKRNLPFGQKVVSNVQVAFKCLECDGKGYLENHTSEKYFVLSAEDFADAQEGRRILHGRAYRGAPSGAEEYVEMLVSRDPEERLEACEWLDRNYVRVGKNFQELMPMLRKARYHEANEKKRIMVWQFWAGKDLADAKDRAFYRIYVNSKSGKVTEKGFYASQR